jgi:geranylgeranyl pyrophosphate synthase
VSHDGTAQVTTDWPAIDAVRVAGGEPVMRLMERLERRLGRLATGHGADLGAFAGSTISAGGKRLRPLLVFLAAGVPVPETDDLLSAAVAVELVHAATLVHDDVLDGSALRRGRPTVVSTGGRTAATATGDLLFSRAFAELRALDSAPAIRSLSQASSELAAGELMQRADAWIAVDEARYLERCRLKTAVLFRAACRLGATAAGASAGTAAELAEFGERVGLAFQLLDDVLDVTGPPERTGKPRGADLLDGTVTLPLILARTRDPELADLDLHSIRTPEAAAQVCERIAATDALDEARTHAIDHVSSAKRLLSGLPPRQRAALDLVADGVVERYA